MLRLFVFTQFFVPSKVDTFRRREDGQTMAEYGVVLSVITLAVLTAIGLLSSHVQNTIEDVVSILP